MNPDPTKCHICSRTLNDPNDETTHDCGGDCVRCMADFGDPGCMKSMYEITGDPRYLPNDEP